MEEKVYRHNAIEYYGFGDEIAFSEFINEMKGYAETEESENDAEVIPDANIDTSAELYWKFSKDALFCWKQKD